MRNYRWLAIAERKEDPMREPQTRVQRIATHLRRIPPIFVEWTSIILILVTVTLCTFSGNFPLISQAVPHAISYGLGCLDFVANTPSTCADTTTNLCWYYQVPGGNNTGTGDCNPANDLGLGGCIQWNYKGDGKCTKAASLYAPQCSSGNFTIGVGCSDGSTIPTCSTNGRYYTIYDSTNHICYASGPEFWTPANDNPGSLGQIYNGSSALYPGGGSSSNTSSAYSILAGSSITDTSSSPCTGPALSTSPSSSSSSLSPSSSSSPSSSPSSSSSSLSLPPALITLLNSLNIPTAGYSYYSCPYPKNYEIDCAVHISQTSQSPSSQSSSSQGSSEERCVLVDSPTNNILSNYGCFGLDSSTFFPQICNYVTKQNAGPYVANSQCTTTQPTNWQPNSSSVPPNNSSLPPNNSSLPPNNSSASSAMDYCTIETCMNANGSFSGIPFNSSSASNSGSFSSAPIPSSLSGSFKCLPNQVQAQILQACTSVLSGTPLTCTYSGNKTEILPYQCYNNQNGSANCAITDLDVKYSFICLPDTTTNCEAFNGDSKGQDLLHSSQSTVLWGETCTPASPGTSRNCSINSGSSKGDLRGNISCPNISVTDPRSFDCTLSDAGNSTTTNVNCTSPFPLACTSQATECPAHETDPHNAQAPAAASTTGAATVSCSESLVATMILAPGMPPSVNSSIGMTYPLGIDETDFILLSTGIGGRNWSNSLGAYPVPVKYL
jgi:hypothetical protein